MAEKRMFTQKIIDSDAFLDMPLSTQALYFHLNMRADDDGFVNSPKRIQRTIGATDDDLRLLIAKRFVICFDNGVIVIKHWRMHNTLKSDRYKPTQYQELLETLEVKKNKAYTERQAELPATTRQPTANQLEPVRNQNGTIPEPQYSIDKNSVDKKSTLGPDKPPRARRFTPPTVEDVTEYCRERGNGIDPQSFIDYYSARGWTLGKGQKMKDWKAAVRTWENRRKETEQAKQPAPDDYGDPMDFYR